MRLILSFIFGSLLPLFASAQTSVNAYARVTNQTGAVLQLTSVNESFDSFEPGEQVLLIQMQDDVIGSNTNNDASFGGLATIANLGNYEVLTISAVNETAGLPTSITLSQAPTRNYSTNAQASLQLVSFPTLGNPNFVTNSDLEALDWNGDIGGVLAFEVNGNLTLNHNISADAAGFRGGAASINNFGAGCDLSVFLSDSDQRGQKGEGVYRSTNNQHKAGRAKILTGGGGGVFHNGGGGGGGNFTAGGQSGHGWIGICGANDPIHAQGGLSLGSFSSLDRLFMGGGGGGGHQNNNWNPNGGDGGGIIFIRANRLRASCANSVSITANGESAADGGNDGMGGGGAGGNIFLDIPNVNVNATCPVDLEADGGNGGNVNYGSGANNRHAGGGGGGQGAIYVRPMSAGNNFTPVTLPGVGGCDNNDCYSSGTNGGGVTNAGVFYNAESILPVTLSYFQAEAQADEQSQLQWLSEEEEFFSHFEVEHSTDGQNFEFIGRVNPKASRLYSFVDAYPRPGYNYYRLRMVDTDGSVAFSEIRAVYFSEEGLHATVYPNPVKEQLYVEFSERLSGNVEVQLFNMVGQVEQLRWQAAERVVELDVSSLMPGIYQLRLQVGTTVIWRSVQVQ